MKRRARLAALFERVPAPARSILARMWSGIGKHRVTGLAAEVAFFALFALPPSLLAFFSAVGFVGRALGPDVIARVRQEIVSNALGILSQSAVDSVVEPTIDTLLRDGRVDMLSVGLLFAIWSTSAGADTLLDALHVVYALDERFALWRRRGLAVLYTVFATIWGAIVLPLLVVGPSFARAIASRFGAAGTFETVWTIAYWPVVIGSVVFTLTAVYHFALPWRTPFLRDLPGALFAMALWIAGGWGLRSYGRWTVESSPIYGSLASPMILLLWLYFTAFALLMGAELNAAIEAEYPSMTRKQKREILRRVVAALQSRGAQVDPVTVTSSPVRASKPKLPEDIAARAQKVGREEKVDVEKRIIRRQPSRPD